LGSRYLHAEQAFDVIDVFEQRGYFGGLWRYTPESAGDSMFSVPQTSPHLGLEQPVLSFDCASPGGMTFMSPIYQKLETNIPKTLMAYSDRPFDHDMQLFPRHDQVQKYLEEYGASLGSLIKFNTQVLDARLDGPHWQLEYENLTTGAKSTTTYDAIVAASGHFSVPHIPTIDGLQDWDTRLPGSISHSKYYRVPQSFKGKKVIVIGSSASGRDIASQISSVCMSPLLLSQRSASPLAGGFADDPNIKFVTQITRVDHARRSVTFEDGKKELDVDHLLFCTGYLYSMPFFSKSRPGSLDPYPITTGLRVEHTYKHLFYAPNPTLAFLTLNQKIIPFPLAEAQSAVLARVWSGRLELPPELEMLAWEKSVIEEQGNGPRFHELKFPEDAEYINELYDWVASAEIRNDLESGGRGKLPKRWGKYEYWQRENFPAIRKAFVSRGEERKHITKLGEVGFEYEDIGKADQTEVNDDHASKAPEIAR
jgi:thioredoxin reductase